MKTVALKVLKTLISHGYEAYIVGGFVRDFLLGEDSLDIDITTNATPEQIMSIFERCIPTGIKHGTVTVVIDEALIEITTYRSDGEYLDHRRPNKVFYSNDVKEDLSRRDFTINSFLMDAEENVVDHLNGKEDLDEQIIRTIGNPSRRFKEDALRMLRAIRFVSKLGFEIHPETLAAIYKHKHLLRNISIERIKQEMKKIFEGKYYLMAKGLLEDIGFPKIDFRYPKYSMNEVEMYACINIENCFDTWEWKFSNNQKMFIHNAYQLLHSDFNCYLLYKIPDIEDYYGVVNYFEGEAVLGELKKVVEQLPIRNKKDLIVTGNDLIDMGFNGVMIGVILDDVERQVATCKLENNHEDVVDYIRRNYDENKRIN